MKEDNIPITETLEIARKQISTELKGHLYSVTCVLFKRSGNQIISGGWDGAVKVFDIDNKEQIDQIMVFDDPVESLLLSPDEKLLAIGVSDSIYILDLESPEHEMITVFSPDYPIRSSAMSFSWDNNYIACATYEDAVKIFSLSKKEEIKEFNISTMGGNRALAFSRDDEIIAIGQMNEEITFHYWKENESEVFSPDSLDCHRGSINSISFSSSGYMVTGAMDSKIKIWDINQGKLITTLKSEGSILTVDFSSLGQVVTGGSDKHTKIVSLTSGKVVSMKHPQTSCNVAVSIDGKYVARGIGKKIVIWDTKTGKVYKEIKGHSEAVNDAVLTETTSNFITASNDRTLHVIDMEGSDIHLLKGHNEAVSSVDVIEAANVIISAGVDDKLVFWDLMTYTKKHEVDLFQENKGEIVTALKADNINGSLFTASGGDFIIREFDLNGNVINQFSGHDDYINAIAVNTEGTLLASASDDNKVIIWNMNGQILDIIECEDRARAVAFDYTGSRLAMGIGENLILYDLDSKAQYFDVSMYQGPISSIAFAPTHEYLIFSTKHQLNLLDLSSLDDLQIITLANHLGKVVKVNFFPDGEKFYSISFDKEIFVYEFTEPKTERLEEEIAVETVEEEYTTTVETVDTSTLIGNINELENTGYYEIADTKYAKEFSDLTAKQEQLSEVKEQQKVEDSQSEIITDQVDDTFLSLVDSVLERDMQVKEDKADIDTQKVFSHISKELKALSMIIEEDNELIKIYEQIVYKLISLKKRLKEKNLI